MVPDSDRSKNAVSAGHGLGTEESNDRVCGIPWVKGGRLTDLDFADNMALMDYTLSGMTELTRRIGAEAGAVGVRISAEKKTMLMAVRHT